MYQLPIELQYKIYKYDSTYYEIFEKCLYDIRNALYVSYSIKYKRTKNRNSLIEIYSIAKIGKKNFTPEQSKQYIKNNNIYKFLVTTYYATEYANFKNIYYWFGENQKNLVELEKLGFSI
jgi:hypothetical protein